MAAYMGTGDYPPELVEWKAVERVGGWMNYILMPPRLIDDAILDLQAENMAKKAIAAANAT